jgi:hypothetical protein
MNDQSFTTTIVVDQTPQEVFNAVNNVRGWWSEEIEGESEKQGDEFAYHYQDIHRCYIKVIEIVQEQKITWLVLNNHFNFTRDSSEWKDTKIIFEISRRNNRTELRFTHLGLVPAYECYEICFDAWTNYITDSLQKLITEGKGKPITKQGNEFQSAVEERL